MSETQTNINYALETAVTLILIFFLLNLVYYQSDQNAPVAGAFGEVSEDTHALLAALAPYRVRETGVSRGRKGHLRTEEAERALAISSLRRRLGVLTARCQTHSLLGRLDVLGPGSTAAAGRRWQAAEIEKSWRIEDRAHSLAISQGWRNYRTGFGKTI